MVYLSAFHLEHHVASYYAYVARDSKADQVYSTLRDEILNGRLRPGDSLSVLKVAERFGASRTPVREAFVRLETDGLVSLIDRQEHGSPQSRSEAFATSSRCESCWRAGQLIK